MSEETTVEETIEEVADETPEQTGEEEASSPEEAGENEDSTVEGLKAAAIAERKKRQAAEAEVERLKAEQKPVETPTPAQTQESIEDMYIRDPKGTVNLINTEIARLVEEDPYTNAVQIEQLRDLKVDLRETSKTKVDAKVSSFVAKVNTEIPDFQTKQAELTKFAVEQLGYTVEDLASVTNFNIVGERAALATIKAINKHYDLAHGKTVKKVTQAPEPITALGGKQSTAPGAEPDPNKDPEAWIAWERERVKKLGRHY